MSETEVALVPSSDIGPSEPAVTPNDGADRHPLFWVQRDEDWSVDGASVRVALVCFAAADEPCVAGPVLDGQRVDRIYPNLRTVDDGAVRRLAENAGIAFQGVKEAVGRRRDGPGFKLTGTEARSLLRELGNPNGRPNSDVVRQYWDGEDITERPKDRWIVDYGPTIIEAEAQGYTGPFTHVRNNVYPLRTRNPRRQYRDSPWRLGEARPALRAALAGKARCIVRSETSRQPVFGWMDTRALPSGSLIVVTVEDDLLFGLLHARAHAVWTAFMGNRMGAGNDQRYNHRRTFETFPFPPGLAPTRPLEDRLCEPQAAAIATIAAELDQRRHSALFPLGAGTWIAADDDPTDARPVAPGSAPYPDRFVSDPAYAGRLADLTLASLYAKQDAWLTNLHGRLDRLVHQAYGWPEILTDEEILDRLLELNRQRSAEIAARDADADDAEQTDDPDED